MLYLPISSASYDLAGSDCAARAAHKTSSRSALSRRTSAALQSWVLDRRQQQSLALRKRSNAHQRPLGERIIRVRRKRPQREPTTKIADFCNKICQEQTKFESAHRCPTACKDCAGTAGPRSITRPVRPCLRSRLSFCLRWTLEFEVSILGNTPYGVRRIATGPQIV
jgi:hypothetical protein